jgi:hypothetical protein
MGIRDLKAGTREGRAKPEEGSADPEERKGSSKEESRKRASELIGAIGECFLIFGVPHSRIARFVREYLTGVLMRDDEIPEEAKLVKGSIDGEKVDIFLEDPLIVGDVVEYAGSINKIMELLRKAELARAKYSREPKKILVVLRAKRDVVQEMERIAKEKGVELMIGKVVD